MKIKRAMIGALGLGGLAGLLRVVQYFVAMDREGYFLLNPLSKVLQGALVGLLLVGFGFVWLVSHGKKEPPMNGNESKWITYPVRLLFLALAAVAILDMALALLNKNGFSPQGSFYLVGALGWALLACGAPRGNLWGLLTLLHSGACVVTYFWNTYRYLHISEYSFGMLGLCVILLMNLQLVRGMAGGTLSKERLVRNCCYLLVLGFTAFVAPLFRLILWQTGAGELVVRSLYGIIYMVIALLVLKKLPTAQEPEQQDPAGERAETAETPDLELLREYISELPEVEEETDGEEE